MSQEQPRQKYFPFFKLPAEIRVMVYEFLRFPPINNDQCRGLILSCQEAKSECEKAAVRNFKVWLNRYKVEVLLRCGSKAEILITPPPPIPTHGKFNTLRNLTLVLPADLDYRIHLLSRQFFIYFRLLNPIFALWLDKLTIHFRGITAWKGSHEPRFVEKTFTRLLFIINCGLVYAHDPAGQEEDKRLNKYGYLMNYWGPEPAFIKKIIVSWDFTEQGLAVDDMVRVQGNSVKRSTHECIGARRYTVMREDGLVGEMMKESWCRFRPCEKEQWHASPGAEHLAHCRCRINGNYVRYMRGFPSREDGGNWI